MSLLHDQASNTIQAMPFVEGKIGITSGTVANITLIRCTADGGLTLTFPSGGTKAVTMTAGEDRSIERGSSATRTSGTFDFA